VPTSEVLSNGSKTFVPTTPVFDNDTWQQTFNYFNIDDTGREKLQTQLNDAATKASALYNFPPPAWSKPGSPDPFANSPANVNQTNQQSQTGIQGILDQAVESVLTGGGTQENIVTTASNVASLFDPNNIKSIGTNDKYKKGFSGSKLLVYPIALKQSSLELHRDTCVISMFNYVAPNQDEFFKGTSNVFTAGLKDSSNLYDDSEGRLKEGLGKVILPMPQSFEEKREVQYGEDTMNTLAAGLTQQVLNDPTPLIGAGFAGGVVGVIGALLGNKGGNSSVGLSGIGGAARTGIQIEALRRAGDMLTTPEVKDF